jgi:hypothetical protein
MRIFLRMNTETVTNRGDGHHAARCNADAARGTRDNHCLATNAVSGCLTPSPATA